MSARISPFDGFRVNTEGVRVWFLPWDVRGEYCVAANCLNNDEPCLAASVGCQS